MEGAAIKTHADDSQFTRWAFSDSHGIGDHFRASICELFLLNKSNIVDGCHANFSKLANLGTCLLYWSCTANVSQYGLFHVCYSETHFHLFIFILSF